MKPAILVISHPNTPEKEYILKDFGNFISQYKIPHLKIITQLIIMNKFLIIL
jgi:hypothetical protein